MDSDDSLSDYGPGTSADGDTTLDTDDSDRTEEEEYEDEDALEDESVDLPDPEPRTSHTGEEVESTAKDNNANVNVRSDARPEWKGTELFPPRKGASKVWEHGGFRKNERGQLEVDKSFPRIHFRGGETESQTIQSSPSLRASICRCRGPRLQLNVSSA